MKEENKDLYRIDPLKVRRKIFESYPPGSRQREDMIKEEKLNELGQLNSVVSGVPRELTDSAIENIKSMSFVLFIKSMFFTLVVLGLGFLIFSFNLSAVEIFMSVIGAIIFSFMSLKSLTQLYFNYKLMESFIDSVQAMEVKMKKLKGFR